MPDPMTRDDLEASLRRNLTELLVPAEYHNAVVDNFLPSAEEYAAEQAPREPRRVLHHTSGTDLHPIIGVLAEALENDPCT